MEITAKTKEDFIIIENTLNELFSKTYLTEIDNVKMGVIDKNLLEIKFKKQFNQEFTVSIDYEAGDNPTFYMGHDDFEIYVRRTVNGKKYTLRYMYPFKFNNKCRLIFFPAKTEEKKDK
jgi:hypothetical protein